MGNLIAILEQVTGSEFATKLAFASTTETFRQIIAESFETKELVKSIENNPENLKILCESIANYLADAEERETLLMPDLSIGALIVVISKFLGDEVDNVMNTAALTESGDLIWVPLLAGYERWLNVSDSLQIINATLDTTEHDLTIGIGTSSGRSLGGKIYGTA